MRMHIACVSACACVCINGSMAAAFLRSSAGGAQVGPDCFRLTVVCCAQIWTLQLLTTRMGIVPYFLAYIDSHVLKKRAASSCVPFWAVPEAVPAQGCPILCPFFGSA